MRPRRAARLTNVWLIPPTTSRAVHEGCGCLRLPRLRCGVVRERAGCRRRWNAADLLHAIGHRRLICPFGICTFRFEAWFAE